MSSSTIISSSSTVGEKKYSADATEPADYSRLKFEELAAVAANIAAAKAEQAVSARLSAANQAQKKTASMLNEATAMLNSIKSGLETSSRMQAQLEADIANIKGNAISALSLFVSFFAFITVTINVFGKADSVFSAAVLVTIFWCLLVGFNLIISLQFKVIASSRAAWLGLAFVLTLSVSMILLLYFFGSGYKLFGSGHRFLV
ncbi:hypothetical protein [Pseudomonas sp. SIMBA_068]|uniref:hypothetical protein n=1 Tax=Pseudomonas sp. SIMBA_068 TaxID=3085808 RepID=UPI0039783BAE